MVDVTLGELGRARIPEEWQASVLEPNVSADSAVFTVKRKNASHWNGYTSYAETLLLTVFAEDLELERIPGFTRRPNDDIAEETTGGRWKWKVTREMYDRDPVHEPAWRVRLLDQEKRVLYDWLGYQKQYSMETAKRNIRYLAGGVTLHADRRAFFAARRDWPTDGWRENYAENFRQLGDVAVGKWTVSGPWRYAVDRERPQHFILMYRLGTREKDYIPVDFHGPVTKFLWWDDFLRQDNQGAEGGLLSEELLAPLRGEFPDRGKVYFYSVQKINLWQKRGPINIEEMKRAALSLEKRFRAGTLVTASPPL